MNNLDLLSQLEELRERHDRLRKAVFSAIELYQTYHPDAIKPSTESAVYLMVGELERLQNLEKVVVELYRETEDSDARRKVGKLLSERTKEE